MVFPGDNSERNALKKGSSVKKALYANRAPIPNNKNIGFMKLSFRISIACYWPFTLFH